MSDSGDLQGKVFVVTGANSGIGFVAAQNFANRGASVALICRSRQRGEAALARIRAANPAADLRLYVADFSLLTSVSTVAEELLRDYSTIDVLCNNAGGANGARQETAEGFEKTFVTNHLSGFLFTQAVLPALLRAAETGQARVVFTSSLGHKHSPLNFDDLGLQTAYSTLKAYGRSKLMNLLTARELHRRYSNKGLIVSSFHPGAVRTAIWGKGGLFARLLGVAMYPFMIGVEQGGETLIWLASSNDADAVNAAGNYFFEKRRASTAPFATDAAAQRLWDISEKLVKPYRTR